MDNTKYKIKGNSVVQISQEIFEIDPIDFNHKCFRCNEPLYNPNKIGDRGFEFKCCKCGLEHGTYHY